MRRRWLRWVPVLLWCALIFYATASPAYSGDHTRQVISQALPAARRVTVAVLNVVVRKSGHLLAFGVLAALIWWALPSSNRRGAWTVALAALYAASDEWHQSFVPGRSAEIADVFLDTAAALLAVVAIRTWTRRRPSL